MSEPEWIKCTSTDDEVIRINVALATVIEPRKKGARVRFIGETFVDVIDTPDELSSLMRQSETDEL